MKNHLGETIKPGTIVKSSRIFKEKAKNKDKDGGYWLEFSKAKIKTIHSTPDYPFDSVTVFVNGYERTYPVDYVIVDNGKEE